MKLTPVLTEKSLNLAKSGNYTFWVDPILNKNKIKAEVEYVFGVHVIAIKTLNYKGGKRRTMKGEVKSVKPKKKAIVTLKAKEKIDLFEESK